MNSSRHPHHSVQHTSTADVEQNRKRQGFKENLMNVHRPLFASLGIAMLFETSSFAQQVKTDYNRNADFSRYNTYSWQRSKYKTSSGSHILAAATCPGPALFRKRAPSYGRARPAQIFSNGSLIPRGVVTDGRTGLLSMAGSHTFSYRTHRALFLKAAGKSAERPFPGDCVRGDNQNRIGRLFRDPLPDQRVLNDWRIEFRGIDP